MVGPTGRFQRLGIIGQRADRTSDRRRRYVLSRAKAGLGQSPCTLCGAVCVPRVCRRDRAGFGARSKSVLRHRPSTLPAGIPPTRTRSPPAEGAQRDCGVTAPSNRRHEIWDAPRHPSLVHARLIELRVQRADRSSDHFLAHDASFRQLR